MLAPMEGYKTLGELAARWGRSQPTLRQQIAKGVLVAEKVGRDWLVADADAERYERERLGRRGVGSPSHPLHGVGRRKNGTTAPTGRDGDGQRK